MADEQVTTSGGSWNCSICSQPYEFEYEGERQPSPQARSKKGAILFAIFGIGLATWLYTWDVDKRKFKLNGIVVLFTLGIWLNVIWIAGTIMAIRRPESFYLYYPNEKG